MLYYKDVLKSEYWILNKTSIRINIGCFPICILQKDVRVPLEFLRISKRCSLTIPCKKRYIERGGVHPYQSNSHYALLPRNPQLASNAFKESICFNMNVDTDILYIFVCSIKYSEFNFDVNWSVKSILYEKRPPSIKMWTYNHSSL